MNTLPTMNLFLGNRIRKMAKKVSKHMVWQKHTPPTVFLKKEAIWLFLAIKFITIFSISFIEIQIKVVCYAQYPKYERCFIYKGSFEVVLNFSSCNFI